jgi:hypothetical protein
MRSDRALYAIWVRAVSIRNIDILAPFAETSQIHFTKAILRAQGPTIPESPFNFNNFPADPMSWCAREDRNSQTE